MWDYFSTMKTAEDKGRAEGRAEGRDERTLEIARNLKTMDYSNEDIAKATGLSMEEIGLL
jgi:predicted transposase/invertase (TIGR01784 family)